MEEKVFTDLTQTGFELELQRVEQQISSYQEKIKKLSMSRAKLFQLAKKLKLKV